MLAELAWLVAAAGWPPAGAALRLLPGALMMIALKAALVGADWRWIAAALALSLPAHIADLRLGSLRRR